MSHGTCPLLNEDAVDEPSVFGCRPLHVACGHGHVDIVNFLLANNADVNVKSIESSLTPLQVYCSYFCSP